MSDAPTTVPVSGVWVRSVENDGAPQDHDLSHTVEVLVEVDEEWRVVARFFASRGELGSLDDIVDAAGILAAK